MSTDLVRKWVNQPSVGHDYHNYHGRNVLMEESDSDVVMIWFTSGSWSSAEVHRLALSDGWTTDPRTDEIRPLETLRREYFVRIDEEYARYVETMRSYRFHPLSYEGWKNLKKDEASQPHYVSS